MSNVPGSRAFRSALSPSRHHAILFVKAGGPATRGLASIAVLTLLGTTSCSSDSAGAAATDLDGGTRNVELRGDAATRAADPTQGNNDPVSPPGPPPRLSSGAGAGSAAGPLDAGGVTLSRPDAGSGTIAPGGGIIANGGPPPECTTGAARCSGSSIADSCVDGRWRFKTSCNYLCTSGACTGECYPGISRFCLTPCMQRHGNQTCSAAGMYGACVDDHPRNGIDRVYNSTSKAHSYPRRYSHPPPLGLEVENYFYTYENGASEIAMARMTAGSKSDINWRWGAATSACGAVPIYQLGRTRNGVNDDLLLTLNLTEAQAAANGGYTWIPGPQLYVWTSPEP